MAYFVALQEPIISRRANSAALALSIASRTRCLTSMEDFIVCLLKTL